MLKTTNIDELTDMCIGKKGTKERDEFEEQLKRDLEESAQSEEKKKSTDN